MAVPLAHESRRFPAKAHVSASSDRGWTIGGGALLVAAGLIVYAATFDVPFLMDDRLAIMENPSIRSVGNIGALLSPPDSATTAGRPVLNLTFAINYAFTGLQPWSYHVVNLLVHVLAGLTLFGVVRRTLQQAMAPPASSTRAVSGAAFVAGLWLLHPLQTAAVTYVSQRAESMMGLFYLLTVYCFVRARASANAIIWSSLSAAACFAGMATKEVMVSAPLLMLLYDRAFVSGSFREAITERRWYYTALVATWALLGTLMVTSGIGMRNVSFTQGVGWWIYGCTQTKVVLSYLKLALWPHPLVFDYGPNLLVTGITAVIPHALAVSGLAVAAVACWRWSRTVGFLATAFFVLLAPTSSIVPVVLQPMAESRMYLPLAPLCGLAVIAAFRTLGGKAPVALIGLSVVFGGLAWSRNACYRSAVHVWEDAVEKQPSNPRAHSNLGFELAKIPARAAEAQTHYRKALELDPNHALTHNNLAAQLVRDPGQLGTAIAHYEKALAIDPDYAEAHFNLGLALLELPERLSEARRHFEEAIRMQPNHAEARACLGVCLMRTGRHESARIQLSAAAKLKPDFGLIRLDLAQALAALGRHQEAIDEYRRALDLGLAVRADEAWRFLGKAFARVGDNDAAVRALETACAMRRDDPESLCDLAAVLTVRNQAGDRQRARRLLESALAVAPGWPAAITGLERLRETSKP